MTAFAINLIEILVSGGSDKRIRSEWKRRPRGMKLEQLFDVLTSLKTQLPQTTRILAANEFEKILTVRRRRSAVPKAFKRMLKQMQFIKKVMSAMPKRAATPRSQHQELLRRHAS